jgi:hypothetical protein
MNKNGNSLQWRTDVHALKKYQFLYHFLPHPEEKRRATLLLNKSIFTYCLLIVSVGLIFRLIPVYLPGVLGYASNINSADLLTQTNKKRAEAGLPALSTSDKLASAAQKKGQHMFKKGYWAHVAPDGTEPWDFILGEGYDYVYAGENLAKNFGNSKDVVSAWMNSPSHKQNLMNQNYTDVGYAVVNGVLNGYESTIVVQMFGKPRYAKAGAAPAVQKQNIANVPSDSVKAISAEVVEQPEIYTQVEVTPVLDVRKATKILSLVFGGFIIALLVLDMWYSKKMGITKINGHTLAHVTFLLLVIVSIWFVLKPGAIL